jgi:DNA-binding PadR family transcriptional regulator
MLTGRVDLSNTAGAVLGMVAIGARSGYEIGRAVERSLRFFWALGPPQIYAELRRLEAEGLLRGADETRGKRPRRTFEVTAAGERALRTWLERDEPVPLELRDPQLLRLFFADALPGVDASARVDAMRRRSERALDHFRAEILPAADGARADGFALPGEVARFGVELHEFIVGWCDRVEAELGEDRG